MKMLGARSLSTVLRVLVDGGYFLMILAMVLAIMVMAFVGLTARGTTSEEFPVSFTLDDASYHMDPIGGEPVTGQIVKARGDLKVTRQGGGRIPVGLAIALPALGVAILLLHKLRQLLRRLDQGQPFATENARTLRFIGFVVIAAEVAWGAVSFTMTQTLASEFVTTGIVLRPAFVVRGEIILIGLALLIVAEVFRLGAVMRQDLDTAREIQFSLVPSPVYEKGVISIHSSMQPARTVGGDYYDVVELDDGRLSFVVADVAGKGIPAALLMTLLQGSLRSLLSSGLRGAELVTRLNSYLVANTPANRMITFFYGELDPASGELRYVNAGHNPPFLQDRTGLTRLLPTGMVLGVLDGPPFSEERIQLEAGGRLLAYTDGVTEAANPADEEFGEDRLERLLTEKRDSLPTHLLQTITGGVLAFCGKAKPGDDMTMMVVSRSPAAVIPI